MKGYYQPAGLVGVVNWAWILMIALFSLIMQLEVTHFNIWTAVSLVIFLVVAGFTIMRRRVTIEENGTAIRFKQLSSLHTTYVTVANMHHVQFTKHGILFSHDGETYNMWVSKKMHAALQEMIEG